MRSPNRDVLTVAVAVLAVMVLLMAWRWLPLAETVRWLQDDVRQLGYVGVVLFIVLYAGAVVAMAPATPFTLAAGVLYGYWGIAVSLAGALLGATVAFLLARTTLRDSCGALCDRYLVSQVLDQVVERLGWRAVLLLRLSPLVPFSAQNYVLGMTGIGTGAYVGASLVGMVPATIVEVMISTTGASDASRESWGLIGIGILATALLIGLVAKRARRALAAAAALPSTPGPSATTAGPRSAPRVFLPEDRPRG